MPVMKYSLLGIASLALCSCVLVSRPAQDESFPDRDYVLKPVGELCPRFADAAVTQGLATNYYSDRYLNTFVESYTTPDYSWCKLIVKTEGTRILFNPDFEKEIANAQREKIRGFRAIFEHECHNIGGENSSSSYRGNDGKKYKSYFCEKDGVAQFIYTIIPTYDTSHVYFISVGEPTKERLAASESFIEFSHVYGFDKIKQDAVCHVAFHGASNADGSSWAAAMDLHTALATKSCNEIWVQEGTYRPDAWDRTASFRIEREVKLYGGFAGRETRRKERNASVNLTTLSGDVGVSNDHSDNSYTVLWIDGTTINGPITTNTVIDGFIIEKGSVKNGGGLYTGIGAGLYCNGVGEGSDCSPELANIHFLDNQAFFGGAMCNDGSKGGASSPVLNNVVFQGNFALGGGAIFNNAAQGGISNPRLKNVSFSNNRAGIAGGAMFNDGREGGISSPELTNVTFRGNHSEGGGGAIYNHGSRGGASSPRLTNASFHGNSATEGGGAMSNSSREGGTSNPTLINVTFSSNHAGKGGAMFSHAYKNGTSRPELINVILWNNAATGLGNEVLNKGASPQIRHSVVRNSGGSDSWNSDLGVDMGGNLDADPKLGRLQDNGGFTQTLLPGAGSSVIDSGDREACPDHDQRGVIRPQGAGCDIGAVEVD